MNFEKLWEIICDKNKVIFDDSEIITLKKDNFKKALRLAFDQGMKEQDSLKNKKAKTVNNPFAGVSGLEDIFGCFGKEKKNE